MSRHWPSPPLDLAPAKNCADIFLARTALSPEAAATAQAFLSDPEKQQISRMLSPAKRIEAVASRALVRHVLSQMTATPPAQLTFTTRANGKPLLLNHPLAFNLSHTAGLAILAVAQEELGIDIEILGKPRPHAELAARFFTPQEHAALIALPLAEQPTAFVRAWTRKESVLKATGEGLVGLQTHPVPFHQTSHPIAIGSWFVHEVKVPADYVASLATANDRITQRCWQIDFSDFPSASQS